MLASVAIVYLLSTTIYSYQPPFSTSGNSVVDSSGTAVKLRCVNWAGSMETLLPEGLQHNSIDGIALLIQQMNFNCVRLTYSIDTTQSPSLTVRQSLARLNLLSAFIGFNNHNPTLIDASVSDVFDAVLDSLGRHNLLVLLDNHVSKAMWCCSDSDGNGFWGDKYFDVDEWINGLKYMAAKTINRHHVIAMSLRNELRGLRETETDWYHYMLRGIQEAIMVVNPQLLIVVSGLNYDLDLSFIRNSPIQNLLPQSIRNKIVYEGHWYSWSNYDQSTECSKMQAGVQQAWGYLLEENQPYTTPVWLTEFGTNVDQFSGTDLYINCVRDYVLHSSPTTHISWAYWVLGGSYYIREGIVEYHESFSLLTDDWSRVKSQSFINILSQM
ncbi:unnamed protein product [Adineta steineri]|uniref:Glycoside hydrolase family 5 domain-containing protein n=2 Tax=Adineta steineri TaxID=433720 RepID=A0A818WWS7_9BILA|nr:unnamed protein product [Adineta steineri]CAF3729569.1 unnamed protein product [Adineta steineri]